MVQNFPNWTALRFALNLMRYNVYHDNLYTDGKLQIPCMTYTQLRHKQELLNFYAYVLYYPRDNISKILK